MVKYSNGDHKLLWKYCDDTVGEVKYENLSDERSMIVEGVLLARDNIIDTMGITDDDSYALRRLIHISDAVGFINDGQISDKLRNALAGEE